MVRQCPDLELFEAIYQQIKLVKPDASVIDIGCGRGDFLKYLRDKDAQLTLTGIDLSFNPETERISFIQANILDGTPTTEEYDVVVSMQVIEHLDDVQEFSKRMIQLCRPGGMVIISTINDRSVLHNVSRVLRRAGFTTPYNHLYKKHHLNHFNVGSLRRLVESQQLKVKNTRVHQCPMAALDLPPGITIQKMGLAIRFMGGPGARADHRPRF